MNEGVKYIMASFAVIALAAVCAYVDVNYFK